MCRRVHPWWPWYFLCGEQGEVIIISFLLGFSNLFLTPFYSRGCGCWNDMHLESRLNNPLVFCVNPVAVYNTEESRDKHCGQFYYGRRFLISSHIPHSFVFLWVVCVSLLALAFGLCTLFSLGNDMWLEMNVCQFWALLSGALMLSNFASCISATALRGICPVESTGPRRIWSKAIPVVESWSRATQTCPIRLAASQLVGRCISDTGCCFIHLSFIEIANQYKKVSDT